MPAPTDAELKEIAERLGTFLKEQGLKIACAESCTGGWVAKAITDVAGSSAWFEFGYVAYADGAKRSLLGVQAKTLGANGAVSEPVVLEMATGALERSGADIAVAVSGIAGPDGAVAGKPVGTVWFGWARRHGQAIQSRARLKIFEGDRESIRRRAVRSALLGVMEEG